MIRFMKALRVLFCSLVVSAAIGCVLAVEAAPPPLVITEGDARAERVQEFGGVLDLDKLESGAEDGASTTRITMSGTVIMNRKSLEALFEIWMLGDPPTVDFGKQVVTATTWGGSHMEVMRFMDKEGNLSVNCGGGSKDLVRAPGGGRGVTFLIEVYTLTNIRSVNGQKWPPARQEAEQGSAEQPATAPGSKTKSGEEPERESEGRSR